MKLKESYKEIIRFLIIGGIATILDYLVYFTFKGLILKNLLEDGYNIIISECLGYIAGLIFNWIFSKGFVFHFEGKSTTLMFVKYVILCLIGLGLSTVVMYLAKPLFDLLILDIFGFSINVIELGFKVLMTLIVLIINYLGRKYFIFVKRT